MNKRSKGFTLIELMIVVVIVGILAAIAYPSYTEFVRRSNRAEAKTALLENAQFLERNFTMSNRYNQDGAGNTPVLPNTDVPRDGTAKYTIVPTLNAASFLLEAEPVSGGPAANDPCGTLTLNHLGVRGVDGGTLDAATCWGR